MLNGVATAAVAAPSEASLVDQVPGHRRGEALGFHLTMSMVGFNMGPVFGGAIQSLFNEIAGLGLELGYRVPFFVDSVLALIAFLLVWWGVDETRGQGQRSFAAKDGKNVVLGQRVRFSLRILYISSLTIGCAVGFIILISVLYYKDIFQQHRCRLVSSYQPQASSASLAIFSLEDSPTELGESL